jgi:hypothetical protein
MERVRRVLALAAVLFIALAMHARPENIPWD